MNLQKLTILMVCMFGISLFKSQSIESTSFGKGIFHINGKDDSWSMNFSARMQFLGTNTWAISKDEFDSPETNFLVRRARLKFDGFVYSPKLEYKIELGLSNRDIGKANEYNNSASNLILDALVMWNFYENFELWVGQTKLPGNRERIISSGNMQLVDRSELNSTFNIDRDMGIQVRHKTQIGEKFVMKEALSLAQGEGRNVTTGNLGGHQYTARVELLPFGEFESKGDYSGGDLKREEQPKLALAGVYDFNNNAVKTRSNQGSYMTTSTGFYETNINTIFVDAMFKYKGISVMAEYAHRTADDAIAKNEDGTPTGKIVEVGNGLNLQAGYLFKNNWEVAGRFTQVELDKVVNNSVQNQYTLGFSKYIVGHKLKVQSDLSYTTENAEASGLGCRVQLDVHF